MYRDVKLQVSKKHHHKRVDLFLREIFEAASRSNIRSAFLSKAILVNGKVARKAQVLNEGDRVLVKFLSSSKKIKYWPNLIHGPRVIFKDEHIAAFYKPPFMHTLPKHYGEKDTLANFAAYMFTGDLDEDYCSPPLFLSRLDYETSGLVLMARSGAVHRSLKERQGGGKILKTYALVVEGEVESEVIVKNAIVTTGGGKVKVDRREHSADEYSQTKFIPEKVFNGYSLLRAEIRKARMHQIRAHASYSGFPIVGDVKYGGKVFPPMKGLPLRPLLHSAVVEFSHVTKSVNLKINCPYPEDLVRVLDYLHEFSDSSR